MNEIDRLEELKKLAFFRKANKEKCDDEFDKAWAGAEKLLLLNEGEMDKILSKIKTNILITDSIIENKTLMDSDKIFIGYVNVYNEHLKRKFMNQIESGLVDGVGNKNK